MDHERRQANTGTIGEHICRVLQIQRRYRRFRNQARVAQEQRPALPGTPGDLPAYAGANDVMGGEALKGQLLWRGDAGASLVGIFLVAGKAERLPHAESIW